MKNYELGKRIKNLRTIYKLTQERLGEVLGFSARTVSDWENGNTEPNLATVKALVNFFDITYEWFFEHV